MLVLESSSIMLMLYFVDFVVSFPSYFLKPSVTLNEFIKYYEPAFYDAKEVSNQHKRIKREAENYEESRTFLKLTISTSDRKFKLLLRPDQSLFADDVQFEGAKGRKINFDVGTAYVGTLEGDERTKVWGIITKDGLFDGTVTTQFEEFYIEPVSRYKPLSKVNAATDTHTIVYKISDVIHPTSPLCAVSNTRTKQKPTDLNTIAHRSKRKKRGITTYSAQNQNEMISKLTNKSSNDYVNIRQQALRGEQLEASQGDDKWPKFTNLFVHSGGVKTEHKFKESTRSADSFLSLENFDENFSKLNNGAPTKSDLSTLFMSRSSATNDQERDSVDFTGGNPDSAYYDLDVINFAPDWNAANKKWQNEESRQFDFNDDQYNKFKPLNDTVPVHEINSKHWRPKTGLIDTVYKYTNVTKNSKNHPPSLGIIQKKNPKILIGNGAEESRANLIITSDDSLEQHARRHTIVDPKKTTCMLYLQADHLFYEKYGTEETCIEVMTRHVQRVNSIYRNTDFNQDGKPDNISFMIKRIKVHSTKDPSYRFPGNYGVEKFLEIFSEEDYDAFCLAYMFTYRDFEMGTLGLAWTGDLKNAGGVCEKNGHYRGSLKSLNTGIVTVLNYGKHVPSAVSHVTLAHEIGHNFGSPHDPDGCTPGGDDGNFIMFARATSGDKKNNNKFSPCSLHAINPVLNVKARSSKGCFTEPQTSICGNGVVEPGEECDCGWEEDCKDTCCYPQRRYPPVDETPCHLTPNALCSPSQGPCCTTDCKIKTGDMCRNDNGCRDSSYCNGKSPQCPPSVNKPNKTVCNEEFVCYMGECTGSICLAYGLESCQCIPTPTDPSTKACELCCKIPGENQPCLSSFHWNHAPYDVPDKYAKPGTPCNDYNGYCDVFRKCREVDPSGPIATLRKLLLSEENIASFKKWAFDHWYYCGLIFLSFILLMILSTKILGKKLKVKAVTVLHSSPTETVRLPTDGSGGPAIVVHPTVVRSKLPFKKKVHENKRRIKLNQKDEPVPHNVNNNNSPVEAKKKAKRQDNKVVVKPNKIKTQKISTKEIATSSPVNKASITISEDPLGKVRNWLINSHNIDGLGSLKKSKSSPAGFDLSAEQTAATAAFKKRPKRINALTTTAATTAKTEVKKPKKSKDSTRVKLQVVYKPPFKFSLKLGKHKNEISSQLIKDKRPEAVKQRAALLVRADRIRTNGVTSAASPTNGTNSPAKTPTPAVKNNNNDKSKLQSKITTESLAKVEPMSSNLRVEYKRSVSAPQSQPVYENAVLETAIAPSYGDVKPTVEEPQYVNIPKNIKNEAEIKRSFDINNSKLEAVNGSRPIQSNCKQNYNLGMKRRNSGELRISSTKQNMSKMNMNKRRNSCDAGKVTNKQLFDLSIKRQYSDETDTKSNQKRGCTSDEFKQVSTQHALRASSKKSNLVNGGNTKPIRLKVPEVETSKQMKRKNSRDKTSSIIPTNETFSKANERRSDIRRSMSNNVPQNDGDKFKRYSLQNVDLTKFSCSEEKNNDEMGTLNRELFELPFRPVELTSEIPSDLEVLLSETENTITEGG